MSEKLSHQKVVPVADSKDLIAFVRDKRMDYDMKAAYHRVSDPNEAAAGEADYRVTLYAAIGARLEQADALQAENTRLTEALRQSTDDLANQNGTTHALNLAAKLRLAEAECDALEQALKLFGHTSNGTWCWCLFHPAARTHGERCMAAAAALAAADARRV